jgi:hypothetical protein
MTKVLSCVTAAFIISGVAVAGRQQAPAGPVRPAAAAPDAAFVKQYCLTCHNSRTNAGGLALDALAPLTVDGHAEVWEKVVRKLRTGTMPPDGAPKPTPAARQTFTTALEAALDGSAARRPDPGAPALHRLNRAEYSNAIRDLLALDVDVSALLPPDDSTAGFDNIADVLGVSPALIEGYVAAATKISRLAVGDPSIGFDRVIYRVPGDLSQDSQLEGLPIGTRGGTVVRHTFPLDAEYDLQVGQAGGGARLGGAPPAGGGRGEGAYVAIDGVQIAVQGRGATRIRVSAGPHTLAAAAIAGNRTAGADGIFDIPARAPGIAQVAIAGPYNATGPGDTPSRRRLFVCRPASAAEEEPCARRILSTLLTRAYRRPVAASAPELTTPLEFYRAGRGADGFERGIQRALARVLVDPSFLFRFEREPAAVAAGAPYRIGDLELASRLSFFLWSSIPDDELIAVAAKGALKDAATLERQVRRMLADPRADALVANFAGQWLFLRELKNARPDSPDFDANLRTSMQRETELLFRTILQEDRSVVELLDSDFTFVDERLAQHYGIPNVYGSDFRRVAVPSEARRGLLGQGSILTVTSAPNRTSPVTRGAWILENLLGTPPPLPPPNVPAFPEKKTGQGVAEEAVSVRDKMIQHRTNQPCLGCHQIMDPIGLALENFDGVGRWRTAESGVRIDASGKLVDGTPVDGAESLRRALMNYPDAFVQTMTEKLLMYGVGRVAHHYDMPAVRAITREAARNDFRFSSLVMAIVKSDPFQMRMKAEAKTVN